MRLSELKSSYAEVQKQHSLPTFEQMNFAFEIGRIKRDSGNLLREIRRVIIDKFSYYLKLMETMINPSQASPMFLILLKEITSEDKKVLDSVFSSFMEVELLSYKLDVISNDEDEAEFIKKAFATWNEKSSELLKLLHALERNWKQARNLQKRSRDYFN